MLITLLGTWASWEIHVELRNQEQLRVALEFERASRSALYAVREGIDEAIAETRNLVALFSIQQQVTPEQFRNYLQQQQRDRPEGFLAWLPQVPRNGLSAFEESARRQQPGFQVHRAVAATSPGPVLLPVLHVAAPAKSDQFLGLDLASDPVHRLLFEQARQRGDLVSAQLDMPLSGPDAGPAICLAQPVFGPTGEVRGYILAHFSLAALLLGRLREAGLEQLLVEVRERDGPAARAFRYPPDGRQALSGDGPEPLRFRMPVADRFWEVAFAPLHGRFQLNRAPAGAMLLAGLTLTALLAAYLLTLQDRRRRTAAIIEEQTAALRAESVARERALAALAQSERQLAAIIDHSPAAIYLKDPTLRYRMVNREFEHLLGRNRKELEGIDDFALMTQEAANKLRANDRRALNLGMPMEFEEQVATRFGARTYLSMKFPVAGPDQELWLCGISTDITDRIRVDRAIREAHDGLELAVAARTRELSAVNAALNAQIGERKRTEQALRESEARWRSLVENAPDIVCAVDRELRLLFTNYAPPPQTPEQAVGADLLDFIGAEFRERARAAILGVFEDRLPRDFETTGSGPGRDTRWFATRVGPVIHEDRVVYAILVSRDITFRRQMERALRTRDANLRALTQNANDGLLVHIQGEIVFVNRKLARLLGHPTRKLRHMHIRDITPPSEWPGVAARLRQRTVGNPVHDPYETAILTADGERIPVEVTGARTAWQGETAWLVVFRDVRERKAHEARLRDAASQLARKARHLERANDELQRFSYVVSHDLKAPLRAVSHLITSLEEDLGDRLSAEERGRMRLVRGRVERMDRLIDGLLHYSRLGFEHEQREPVDTEQVVREVLAGIEIPPGFEVRIESPLPPVMANRLHMAQVFANLLGNALGHHDREEGLVTVSGNAHHEAVEFVVTDDGPGVPPEHRERIFEIFQTLSAKDRRESTGIGLSLVRKLVSGWRGRVWVEAAPGRGAAFHFSVPAQAGLIDDAEPGGSESH